MSLYCRGSWFLLIIISCLLQIFYFQLKLTFSIPRPGDDNLLCVLIISGDCRRSPGNYQEMSSTGSRCAQIAHFSFDSSSFPNFYHPLLDWPSPRSSLDLHQKKVSSRANKARCSHRRNNICVKYFSKYFPNILNLTRVYSAIDLYLIKSISTYCF